MESEISLTFASSKLESERDPLNVYFVDGFGHETIIAPCVASKYYAS